MLSKFTRRCFHSYKLLILVPIFASLLACSSPTEKAEAFYAEGVKKMEKGEYAKASVEFRNALQIKPKMVLAWYALAKIAEGEGDFPKLFGLLGKVVELDSKHVEAKIKYGRLLLVAGKLDKALETSNSALELAPTDPAAKSLKAAVLFKLDDTKAAVDLANEILKDHPQYIDALVILAMDRIAAGDSEKAIEFLDQGIAQNEKNLALQLMKVQALSNLKKNDSAIEIYRKLIVLYPESNELKIGLGELYYRLGKMDEAEVELRSVVKNNPENMKFINNLVGFIYSVKGAAEARKELEALVNKNPENYALKFQLVGFYKDNKERKLAETLLNEIAKNEDQAVDALKAKGLLATIALEDGNKEKSSALVEEILKEDKNNDQALILKSSMLLEKNSLDEAIASLRIVLRDNPNSSRALLLLAKAHELAGATALADEHYVKAFKTSKFASQFGIPYAQFLVKHAQVPRAEKALEDILSVNPNDMASLQLLAQLKITQGDWEGAQKVADNIRRLGNDDHVSEQIMGVVFAAKKNYAESISSFERAYKAAPNNIQPIAALVKTYLQAGKTKEAASFLENVLKANPNNVDAKLLQSQLLMINGSKDKAMANFNEIIVAEPNNADAYQQLAMAHVRNNDFIEAEKIIKMGVSKVPNSLGLLLSQAGIYELTKRYDDAITTYETLLKLQPNAEVAVNNYASLISDKRTDKASLEKAYVISQRFKDSEIPQFKDTLGWAAYRVSKYDEAIVLLKSASDKMPNAAIFHYHLGKVYLAKNDKINAKKSYEQVIKLSQKDNFEFYDEVSDTLKTM